MFEAIKKGFMTARQNLKLVLIVYGVGIAFGLLTLPFARRLATPMVGLAPGLPFMFWAILILSIFVQIFVMGGVLGCVQEAIKKGQANLSEFVNFGKKYYVRLLLAGILGFVLAVVYGFIFAALVGGIAAGPVVIKIILGLILAAHVVLGIALLLMLVFWPYAMVIEDIGVIEGLKKSVEMARKPLSNLLKILGIIVILFILTLLINWIVSLPGLLFRRWFIVGSLYRIFITGAVGSFINVAFVSVLMAFYFVIKGEVAEVLTQEPPSTETPQS